MVMELFLERSLRLNFDARLLTFFVDSSETLRQAKTGILSGIVQHVTVNSFGSSSELS